MQDRFFHPDELQTIRSRKGLSFYQSLAARFAAKEAFGKALGSGLKGLSLKDLEVTQDENGKPCLHIHGSAVEVLRRIGLCSVHLSLSHEDGFAMAMVIIEKTGETDGTN
jgi:holo-[acyl-carrier protein] synthase